MRTNSGSGKSKNNNHDATLRDRNPQAEMREKAEQREDSGPSDTRQPRK